MKKNFSLWMLGIAAMLASCSSEDGLQGIDGNDGVVHITARLENGMNTRAVTDGVTEENVGIDHYVLNVYDVTDSENPQYVQSTSSANGNFSVKLERSKMYRFYCWADEGDDKSAYTITDNNLASITLKQDASDASKYQLPSIAHRGVSGEDVSGNTTEPVTIQMTHAVAKLVLKTQSSLKTNSTKVATQTVTSYNAITDTYGSEKADIECTDGLTEDITNATDATPVEVLSFYLMVDGKDTQEVTLSHTTTPGDFTSADDRTFNNVPFQIDYRTVFVGHVDNTSNMTVNFKLDDDWTDVEKEFPCNVDTETNTIESFEPGSLTSAAVTSAMNGTGMLKVKGKINQADIKTIIDAVKYTVTELDLSEVTGEEVSIPRSAFVGAENTTVQLKVIKLGSNVTEIGISAFANCASLTEVDLSGCTNLTTIGNGAFGMCGITSLKLPENGKLSSISASAFYGNASLQTVSIPATIKQLSPYIFSGCTSLTSIIFQGTEAPAMENTETVTFTFADCVEKGNENTIIYLPNVTAETDAWKTFFGEANGWTIKYGESPAVNP